MVNPVHAGGTINLICPGNALEGLESVAGMRRRGRGGVRGRFGIPSSVCCHQSQIDAVEQICCSLVLLAFHSKPERPRRRSV